MTKKEVMELLETLDGVKISECHSLITVSYITVWEEYTLQDERIDDVKAIISDRCDHTTCYDEDDDCLVYVFDGFKVEFVYEVRFE